MSDYYCPVEDCDYPPDSDSVSLSRVRSHINATSEGAHDWDELKPVVLDQANDQDEAGDDQPDEQAEGGDGDDLDEDRDEYEEQWQSTENGPDDPPGGAGAAATSTDEPTDGGDEQESTTQAGRELPVSTPVVVVGLALVVLVAFLAIRSPDGTADIETGSSEESDETEDETDAGPDVPVEGEWA